MDVFCRTDLSSTKIRYVHGFHQRPRCSSDGPNVERRGLPGIQPASVSLPGEVSKWVTRVVYEALMASYGAGNRSSRLINSPKVRSRKRLIHLVG